MTKPINPFANGDPDFYPVFESDECVHSDNPFSPCRGNVEMRATLTGVFALCDKHDDELNP